MQNLFIIGAGFTKAANKRAPLNDKLLCAIIKKDPGTLIKYYEKYKIVDIEKLLTIIDLDLTLGVGASPPAVRCFLSEMRPVRQLPKF